MRRNPDEKKSRPKLKDFKLNALLEVTKAINHNFPTSELLTIYEQIVREKLNIGKLVLFSNQETGWACLLQYGVGDQFLNIDVDKEFSGISEIRTMDFTSRNLQKSFEIVVPVFHKQRPLAYVLIGDLNEDQLELSPTIKHLPFIQTLTNIIIVAIENKKLAKENIRQAAMKKELELAWEMQRLLFPTMLPHTERYEVGALYLPHLQVGGDYYDFIELNENEFVFCVADVSGKGVPAALLMSNFQANLRVLLGIIPSLTELVHELNTKVMSSAKGEKFITLFIAKYNTITRTLTYVNAGHNPPLLVSGGSVNLLKIGCTGLGMFDELKKVKEGIVNISHPSTILSYTDGLVELENEKDEEFGMKRLQELVLQNQKLATKELNTLIIDTVEDYKGDMPYVDDIALFCCKIF
ncbi:MAG: sigma-B regulation protein RsbU (phosphoserine phosphatase) [Bacteroidetes bacterium]|nr:MAG: sigma-B regulation protein RsbU (phosphoserine phosphatase) [Bacteroidota bacterium]